MKQYGLETMQSKSICNEINPNEAFFRHAYENTTKISLIVMSHKNIALTRLHFIDVVSSGCQDLLTFILEKRFDEELENPEKWKDVIEKATRKISSATKINSEDSRHLAMARHYQNRKQDLLCSQLNDDCDFLIQTNDEHFSKLTCGLIAWLSNISDSKFQENLNLRTA